MIKHPITADTLFEQIKNSVKAVATQVPYAQQQILSIDLSLVESLVICYNGAKE